MDMVKAKTEQVVLRYSGLRRAAALSRCLLESLAALALLFWSSDRLPPALALCGGLLRRLPTVIFHPFSAFVVGNAIVVTLLAKSGDAHPAATPAIFDVSDHLGYFFHSSSSVPPPLQLQWKGEEEEEEDVVWEDKAVCVENTTASATHPMKGRVELEKGPCLRRVRSEGLVGDFSDRGMEQKLLCRSVTELGARRKVVAMWEEEEEEQEKEEGEEGGRGGDMVVVVDDSVEFRRKVEAFITKQLRFIVREEEELLFAEVSR